MDDNEKKLDNVIRFPVEAVSRLGLQRAAKRGKKAKMESEGQLNMFERSGPDTSLGEVVALPQQMSPFEEALILDDQGDERAEEVYLQAIRTGDYVADAWCNLGVLRSHGGDLDSAFDCFAQSLANDPQHAESHYNIGNLYFEIGDLRVARTHYEMAAELQPEFASVHFNLGLVTALAEDYRAAFDALTCYKTLAPDADVAIADELLGYIQRAIQLS